MTNKTKAAVVTGAAAGIGAATARSLAKGGADIAIWGISSWNWQHQH